MTDVRSLLRQQKASRRIDHPYATYSAAGKLLCTLCRVQVKSESLWDSHLLSQGHKHKVQQEKITQANSIPDSAPDDASAIHKRKLEPVDEQDRAMEDAVRSKRSKPDIAPLTGIAFNGTPAAATAAAQDHAARSGSTNTPDQVLSAGSNNSKESTKTPPSLIRRLSTTPSQGVELQIPSRPATPAHREGRSASSASASGGYFAVQSQTNPMTPLQPNASAANTTGPASTTASVATPTADKTGRAGSTTPQVDESEWAAFKADIAAAEAPYDEGAVISAPAMTTEEVAAKEAADADRKAQADVDIEDEREEATRALEDEFAEMKELEARFNSLKEKRDEILKKRRESQSQENAPMKASLVAEAVKHNGVEERVAEDGEDEEDDGDEEDDDDDDDDEDEEGDDWDGFRFRT